MNHLIIVIAHGNGQAAFDRHRGYWERHEARILVCEPEDDPVKTTHETLSISGAQHNGPQALNRLRGLLEVLIKREWNTCRIYEYDSFDLKPSLSLLPGFYGCLYANKEAPKFMAPVYANPPWSFDRASFELMREVSLKYPSVTEDGEADRWLSALSFLARVPVLGYSPPGFSRGSVRAEDIENLKTAIYTGSTVIHGIKHAWTLKAAEQFYDERNLKPARELRTRAGGSEFLP